MRYQIFSPTFYVVQCAHVSHEGYVQGSESFVVTAFQMRAKVNQTSNNIMLIVSLKIIKCYYQIIEQY